MSATKGGIDYLVAEEHYRALGPLDANALAYLAKQRSVEVRKRTLHAWYGRSGAVYAWAVWCRHRRALGGEP